MVNKQGQTRLAQYYDFLSIEERVALEAETIRKCLTRNELQVKFKCFSIELKFAYFKYYIINTVFIYGVS